jgi:hypothetical protein
VPESDQQPKPNIVFYEVLTGTLDTGMEVLVQVFREPDGRISLAQLAFRAHKWQTWGPPTRLEHMTTQEVNK